MIDRYAITGLGKCDKVKISPGEVENWITIHAAARDILVAVRTMNKKERKEFFNIFNAEDADVMEIISRVTPDTTVAANSIVVLKEMEQAFASVKTGELENYDFGAALKQAVEDKETVKEIKRAYLAAGASMEELIPAMAMLKEERIKKADRGKISIPSMKAVAAAA